MTSNVSVAPHESYDPAYFAPLFAIEDRHFWFRARNQVIAMLVRQLTAGLAPGYRVLEVGCGTGNVLQALEQACSSGTVVGMDLFAEGLRYARRRTHCPLVQGDAHAAPCATPFALIGLFDVLEHLSDDGQILHDLRGLLAPEGALLLTVPAYPRLWSYCDEASYHCRRYTPHALAGKLRRSGYRIEYLSPYMASLFPLVWLGWRLAAVRHWGTARMPGHGAVLASAELQVWPGINALLAWVLAQETRLLARRCRLPLGTSLVVIARRASPHEWDKT